MDIGLTVMQKGCVMKGDKKITVGTLTATYSEKYIEGTKVIASLKGGGRAILDYKDSPSIDILIERVSKKWKGENPFYMQDWRKGPRACTLPNPIDRYKGFIMNDEHLAYLLNEMGYSKVKDKNNDVYPAKFINGQWISYSGKVLEV